MTRPKSPLSVADSELLNALVVPLTGASLEEDSRKDFLRSNVERLMTEAQVSNWACYLELIDQDALQFARFVSAITIHTTSWFREKEHFAIIERHAESCLKRGQFRYRVFSAACSTGQEVYSLALCLERIRRLHPKFEYEIIGMDIDPLSVRAAERAVYETAGAEQIPLPYQEGILWGRDKRQFLFTLEKSIRERCRFFVGDLQEGVTEKDCDLVVCRNVLIYFHRPHWAAILASL